MEFEYGDVAFFEYVKTVKPSTPLSSRRGVGGEAYQQFRTGILHHKVQTLLRVSWVERLVGAASLQHAERGDGHPLATGNEHRNDILGFETLRDDIGGNAVAHLIDLRIRKPLFFIDHGHIVGRILSLTAEQRDDGLRVVIVNVGLVEAVEESYL